MRFRVTRILSMSLILMLIVSVLSACSTFSGIRIASSQSSGTKHMSSNFEKLSGEETKEIKLEAGKIVTINYDIKVERGDLKIKLNDPEGSEITAFNGTQKGKKDLKVDQNGTYKIIVVGSDAKGSYDLRFEIK